MSLCQTSGTCNISVFQNQAKDLGNNGKQGQIDVLFVNPPVLRFFEKFTYSSFPLGLGYMVAYLGKKGLKAEIYNADVHDSSKLQSYYSFVSNIVKRRLLRQETFNVDFARSWPLYHSKVLDDQSVIWREVARVLVKTRPKIVGISSKVVDIPSTFKLAEIIHQVLPDTPVIVGGPSATTCSDYLMNNRAIDFLVLGEGEETILELSQAILSDTLSQKIASIRGIGYRNSCGVFTTNPKRPLIENLDDIPFPDREIMFMIDRQGRKKYIQRCRDVLTSRGCPYPCTFCCAYKAWGTRKPRFRSIANIVDELEFLHNKYNQKDFVFLDDLFTVDRNRVIDICNEIAKRKLKISWICLSRLNTIDLELLNIMKAAGCCQLQIGIESGNDRILELIKKGITRKMIFEKMPIIKKAGIPCRVFLIIGFPTETLEEMNDTLRLIDEIRPTYLELSLFCPYPGTDLHKHLLDSVQLGNDFMKSDMWYPYNNYTGVVSDSDFQTYAFNALKLADDYSIGRKINYPAASCEVAHL